MVKIGRQTDEEVMHKKRPSNMVPMEHFIDYLANSSHGEQEEYQMFT